MCYYTFVFDRIDGSEEDGSFGRLINDDHVDPKVKPKIITVDGVPCIAFFAVKDIKPGEELTYSYGGESSNYSWRDPKAVIISNLSVLWADSVSICF